MTTTMTRIKAAITGMATITAKATSLGCYVMDNNNNKNNNDKNNNTDNNNDKK